MIQTSLLKTLVLSQTLSDFQDVIFYGLEGPCGCIINSTMLYSAKVLKFCMHIMNNIT